MVPALTAARDIMQKQGLMRDAFRSTRLASNEKFERRTVTACVQTCAFYNTP
jgi:hypothetical protein